jgi:acetylornithine deacetylase
MTTPELLAKLTAFKTVSRDSNTALIQFVAGELTAAGGAVRVLPGDLPGKANLLASFGPTGDGGIILSGHSDVVPVDGQSWSTDPFTLTARDGKLLARGATDMKGFIASAMCAASRAQSKTLRRPLHIAISHDEEVGCIGVRSMLSRLAAEGFGASGCIVGEPTGLRVAIGHKGKIAGCVCCHGIAAHSANPGLGCNAIYLAAGMVQELRALQDHLLTHGARDAAYAVPHSTVHVGTIRGGTVLNIVPERCDLAFEIRFIPGDDIGHLLARLREAADRLVTLDTRAAIDIDITNEYPGVETAPDSGIARLALAATGGASTYKTGFGTEAGLFTQMLGLNCIVCGPGSIDRAHKPDEYVTADELAECDMFLDRIVASLT